MTEVTLELKTEFRGLQDMLEELAATLAGLSDDAKAALLARHEDRIDAGEMFRCESAPGATPGLLVLAFHRTPAFDALLAEARALASPSG